MCIRDRGKIALTPAVELSFLKKDEQENLFATMESEEACLLYTSWIMYILV